MGTVKEWNELAGQLAVDSIRSSTAAGSGHPTSSLSAAHLAAVLWSDHLRYDVADPKGRANDRFVLSKGHASPLMFSILKAVGAIGEERSRQGTSDQARTTDDRNLHRHPPRTSVLPCHSKLWRRN